MCIRDRGCDLGARAVVDGEVNPLWIPARLLEPRVEAGEVCLLYTSDAADERSSVDLGGCRINKKKKKTD